MKSELFIKTGDHIQIQELGPERAQRELESLVFNVGFNDLVKLFGVEELPEDTDARLRILEKIAFDHWDFRKGAERQAVAWDVELIDQQGSEQWSRIFEAGRLLGMVDSRIPENKSPKYLVIYGGANKAPYDRLRFGLESVDSYEHVVFLGSSRPISEVEKKNAESYALDAQTEFDLGCGAIEKLLNGRMVDEIREVRGLDEWIIRVYEYVETIQDESGHEKTETKQAFALCTPQIIGKDNSTVNQRRATTYDNCDFFARVARLEQDPDASIVGVTTGHFANGQHIPAVQELTLQFGTRVETIGHDASYSGVIRKPSQLLQEMKAAIDAAVRLQIALKNYQHN